VKKRFSHSHRQIRKEKKRERKECAYLYGKNSIAERVRVRPESIRNVFVLESFKEGAFIDHIKSKGVQVENVSESRLMRIKRADRMQGIVAEVDPFSYNPIDELITQARAEGRTILCLDSINDPHNLGSIIRIAACFGRFSIVIPRYGACEVTDAVMHVASGGENYVPIAMVNNLTHVFDAVKEAGFTVACTIVESGEDIHTTGLPFPLCLALGSEGKGIRRGLKKYCDLAVRIPMQGAQLSFNVAVASAIFCHEIAKQRESAPGGL
jgi:23S rRNA (guanosine2251-2'-O)-methyltransferase